MVLFLLPMFLSEKWRRVVLRSFHFDIATFVDGDTHNNTKLKRLKYWLRYFAIAA